jgi:hypothetical protein
MEGGQKRARIFHDRGQVLAVRDGGLYRVTLQCFDARRSACKLYCAARKGGVNRDIARLLHDTFLLLFSGKDWVVTSDVIALPELDPDHIALPDSVLRLLQ